MTHPSAPAALDVRNLSVAYHDRLVLERITATVPAGSVFGIVGPNGAGKSTLLRAILGLLPPLAGSVSFSDDRRSRERVAYMPQSASVDWDFPATAFDVVLMGTYGSLGWWRRAGRGERERAEAAMRRTGILELRDRPIGELSGGQRQRVFLARALAQDAAVTCMDEPFQGVDARSERAIIEVLHELRAQGRTVVMVHHDLVTLPEYCDHVLLLNRRVIAVGPVADVLTPELLRETYGAGESGESGDAQATEHPR